MSVCVCEWGRVEPPVWVIRWREQLQSHTPGPCTWLSDNTLPAFTCCPSPFLSFSLSLSLCFFRALPTPPVFFLNQESTHFLGSACCFTDKGKHYSVFWAPRDNLVSIEKRASEEWAVHFAFRISHFPFNVNMLHLDGEQQKKKLIHSFCCWSIFLVSQLKAGNVNCQMHLGAISKDRSVWELLRGSDVVILHIQWDLGQDHTSNQIEWPYDQFCSVLV